MNEDAFNASIRKFLKTLGVTAQREIEKAVRQALADGRLKGNEKLPAKATVTIAGVGLAWPVEPAAAWRNEVSSRRAQCFRRASAALHLEVAALLVDVVPRAAGAGENRSGEDREGRDGGEHELGHGSCSFEGCVRLRTGFGTWLSTWLSTWHRKSV